MIKTSTLNRFALEIHDGPYEKWPTKSRLIVDGVITEQRLPGYSLLHQFALDDGYLLVTDYDCPFEECTNFILLDSTFKKRASRSLGVPYGSFLLQKIEQLDVTNFIATFCTDDRWSLLIDGRRLSLKRIE